MNIYQDKVRKIASNIQINLDDEQVEVVCAKVNDLVDKLEVLLSVDTEGYEPYITSTNQVNVFAPDEDEKITPEFLNNLNNFNGEYFTIEQVMEDD